MKSGWKFAKYDFNGTETDYSLTIRGDQRLEDGPGNNTHKTTPMGYSAPYVSWAYGSLCLQSGKGET